MGNTRCWISWLPSCPVQMLVMKQVRLYRVLLLELAMSQLGARRTSSTLRLRLARSPFRTSGMLRRRVPALRDAGTSAYEWVDAPKHCPMPNVCVTDCR